MEERTSLEAERSLPLSQTVPLSSPSDVPWTFQSRVVGFGLSLHFTKIYSLVKASQMSQQALPSQHKNLFITRWILVLNRNNDVFIKEPQLGFGRAVELYNQYTIEETLNWKEQQQISDGAVVSNNDQTLFPICKNVPFGFNKLFLQNLLKWSWSHLMVASSGIYGVKPGSHEGCTNLWWFTIKGFLWPNEPSGFSSNLFEQKKRAI